MRLLLSLALLSLSAPAMGHEAPAGWSYDASCCDFVDCRQVPSSWIEEGPNGYVIKRTGEVIPYTDTRIRDSKDEHFHWCSVAGEDDTRTLCLYRAPRSF